MKRTNLVVDEQVLKEATRVLGLKTYSATVNKALEEVIRIQKIHGLHGLMGADLWEGNLAEMREDHPRRIEHSRRIAR